MVICGKRLSAEPVWYLNNEQLCNVDSLEIIGVSFNNGKLNYQINL